MTSRHPARIIIGIAARSQWGARGPGTHSEAKALNEKFKARGWQPLKIGVGVYSGMMRVGDMGSKIRRACSVMGDAVNSASWLEGITSRYGADIIIGDGARKLITGIVLREIGRVRVKG